MNTTSSIDWPSTQLNTCSAKNDMIPGKRFVNLNHLVEHVEKNIGRYPAFKGASYKQIRYRVQKAVVNMGWVMFNSKGCRNSVYVDPKVEGE